MPVAAPTELAASPTARSGPPAADLFTATPLVTGEIQASHAPAEVIDAPSDGVIVQHIATVETAPVPRRPPSVPVVDDRPDDTTGEITMPRTMAVPESLPVAEPSILVADLAAETIDPAPSPAVEPLVADLAAVHVAVSAVATAQAAAPATANASTAPQSAEVAATRKDTEAFSELEEDFFRAGHEKTTKPPAPVESFEDLDADYEPVGFWDRVRGKKPKKRR